MPGIAHFDNDAFVLRDETGVWFSDSLERPTFVCRPATQAEAIECGRTATRCHSTTRDVKNGTEVDAGRSG